MDACHINHFFFSYLLIHVTSCFQTFTFCNRRQRHVLAKFPFSATPNLFFRAKNPLSVYSLDPCRCFAHLKCDLDPRFVYFSLFFFYFFILVRFLDRAVHEEAVRLSVVIRFGVCVSFTQFTRSYTEPDLPRR